MTSIAAEREVQAPAEALFAYLADLEQHWQLADRFIEVVSLERSDGGPAHGGVVRMRGPLGISRVARTRVVEAHPPTRMSGTAAVGERTVANVSWTLEPRGERTRARLEATLERASWLNQTLLVLGGAIWLERRFEGILATLEQRVAGGLSQSVPA